MKLDRKYAIRAFGPLTASTTLIGPSVLILVTVLLSLWSWRKWPDLIIDFGRELYFPWQIASGKVLYRDIAHVFGPLSQHFNAMLFKLDVRDALRAIQDSYVPKFGSPAISRL